MSNRSGETRACSTCGGGLRPVVLRDFDFSPILGLPVVVPTFPGYRCTRDRSHVVLDGAAIEQARYMAAFLLLEMGSLMHADFARYLRRYMGLTQAELAAKMGVERGTVARFEGGDPISPQNDYLLRGIARDHLKSQIRKTWARTLDARFRRLPDVFLGGVRTTDPPEGGAAVEPLARAMARRAA